MELDVLKPSELRQAAEMAARALRDNPVSIAVYGPRPNRRTRGLLTTFLWMLSLLRRQPIVARRGESIVGLAAIAPPDQCFLRQMAAKGRELRIRGKEVGLTMAPLPPRLVLPLLRLGPRTLSRMSTWGEIVSRHDPSEAHQHVELVAVEPELQGKGIGSMLMGRAMSEMQQADGMPYLETDTMRNVSFYRRFGFEVLGDAQILGAATWFMGKPD